METIVEAAWRVYPASALMLAGAVALVVAARRALAAVRLDAFARGKGLAVMLAFRLAIVGLAALLLGVAWMWSVLWLAVLAAVIGAGELLESTFMVQGLRGRPLHLRP